MIYANDCSIREVRSYAKKIFVQEIFVQILAYKNYFTKANYIYGNCIHELLNVFEDSAQREHTALL